jgi:hypothetical protein
MSRAGSEGQYCRNIAMRARARTMPLPHERSTCLPCRRSVVRIPSAGSKKAWKSQILGVGSRQGGLRRRPSNRQAAAARAPRSSQKALISWSFSSSEPSGVLPRPRKVVCAVLCSRRSARRQPSRRGGHPNVLHEHGSAHRLAPFVSMRRGLVSSSGRWLCVGVLARCWGLEQRSCLYGLLVGRIRRNWNVRSRAHVQKGGQAARRKAAPLGANC